MPGQRARSAIPADHRSAHPTIPGVPWWGAVLLAVVASALGFAFDAGSGGKELTGVFSALYALGCVAAVLAVRQAAVFTAVIQPPLILFVVVPSAYYLMHSADIHGVKDILINCGYPLIERFPLMFFTSAAVLLLGLARWYFGASARQTAPPEVTQTTGGRLSAKLSSLLGGGESEADPADPAPRRRGSVDRRRSRGAGGTSPQAQRRRVAVAACASARHRDHRTRRRRRPPPSAPATAQRPATSSWHRAAAPTPYLVGTRPPRCGATAE